MALTMSLLSESLSLTDLVGMRPRGGTIYKIKADGSPPNTFASLAGGGAGLAFDSHGNLFATDDLVATDGTITPAIDKLTSEGMMTPFAGPTAFAQYPGAAPGSLAFDASGNLFVGTDDNAPDGADII